MNAQMFIKKKKEIKKTLIFLRCLLLSIVQLHSRNKYNLFSVAYSRPIHESEKKISENKIYDNIYNMNNI